MEETETNSRGFDSTHREPLPTPTVFMFRPSEYVKVPSDRLAEWEQDLREKTGLPRQLLASPELRATETWSICYGEWGWDDCDAI